MPTDKPAYIRLIIESESIQGVWKKRCLRVDMPIDMEERRVSCFHRRRTRKKIVDSESASTKHVTVYHVPELCRQAAESRCRSFACVAFRSQHHSRYEHQVLETTRIFSVLSDVVFLPRLILRWTSSGHVDNFRRDWHLLIRFRHW
jgi:hypothetical protein